MLKVFLVLSEFEVDLSTGGRVAGYERALMMHSLFSLSIAYADWRDQGIKKVDGLPLIQPVSRLNSSKAIRFLWRMYKKTTTSQPWFQNLYSKDQVQKQISSYLNRAEPDIVCFDNIPSTVAWESCSNFPRVYFAHNVESEIADFVITSGRSLSNMSPEARKMLAHEARILNEADAVLCFTKRDEQSLRKLAPNQTFHIVPPAFLPSGDFSLKIKMGDCLCPCESYVIIPTNAKWQPNLLSLKWFVREVLPEVDSCVKFVITGKDQDGFLQRLADTHPNIRYLGLLSREEYLQTLSSAALFVNPTQVGSGFQIKLMEAIRAGVPCISTGFSNHIGDTLTSTDDPANMAMLISSWVKSGIGINLTDYLDLHESVKNTTVQALLDAIRRTKFGK